MMWKVQQLLRQPDAGTADDVFGTAVAVSGDTVLVGACGSGGSGEGAAYVFVRSGAHWSLQQMLATIDGSPGGSYGAAVALQGDTAVVGASEQAYVFTRSGTTWQQTQEIGSCSAATGSFGQSLALDGDTLVVGAHAAACVYVLSGGTWTLQQALTGGGPTFGTAVAVNGDTAIVGAPGEGSTGAADVFVRAGSAWTLQQQLPPPTGMAVFGSVVAVEGDTAMATSLQGAAVFSRTGAVWAQTQLITPRAPLGRFTASSLNGGTLAGLGLGDNRIDLEVFAPNDGGLALRQALFLEDSPSGASLSIAMDGTTIAAGVGPASTFVVTLEEGDGEPCASSESCISGSCINGVCCGVSSCPPAGPCNAAEHCQPGTGTCSLTPIHDGMPCPADACTQDPVCKGGICTGDVKLCPPADECQEFGSCDPSSGQCSNPAKPDGTPCTGGKACLAGVCGGPPHPTTPGVGSKGCACDAAGGAPAGGAVVSWIALAILRRRRRRARRT